MCFLINKKILDKSLFFVVSNKRKLSFCKLFVFISYNLKQDILKNNVILVNNKTVDDFFGLNILLKKELLSNLFCFKNFGYTFNFVSFVNGGGLMSQTKALIYCLHKAYNKIFLTYSSLKKNNKLEKFSILHDSRRKERKKFGLKKARKKPQYHKR